MKSELNFSKLYGMAHTFLINIGAVGMAEDVPSARSLPNKIAAI